MGTIVVGVDGSDGSRIALAWAAAEARGRKDRLIVFHAWHLPPGDGPFSSDMAVVASDGLAKLAQELVDELADDARRLAGPDVEVVGESSPGTPGGELVRYSHHADLLVVGSRGLGGFGGLLLGSVSHQCIQHAHCPVVVIPNMMTKKAPAE